MTVERGPIVVGVDGSAGAETALTWALDEARARKVPVRLIYAFGQALNHGATSMYGNLPVPDLPYLRAAARRVLAETAERAGERAADVSITTDAVDDNAVAVLLEASQQASSVVLGSRQLGAFGSAILGSVGAAVSARGACPVVVLRGPAASPAERPAVIVGVDTLGDSEPVLAYGFDHASRRALPLHAVLCWHPDLLAESMWRGEPQAPVRAEAWLSEALAGWREKYPDVEVHSGVVREHPVAGLVAASNAQHLIVVGKRGHHALPGTLLGSVSQGVLHHARCPVAVIPHPGG